MAATLANSDRDRVLHATDLVALVGEHVALKPKGREHVGLCPFHDDRSPSLAIVTHKGDAFYKCFACGAAGNAIDFVMNFHKMPFGDALRYLATRAGIELTNSFRRTDDAPGQGKDDIRRANALALKFYRRMLHDETVGDEARAVIERRGIEPAMVEAFQLGYAPDQRDAMQSAIRRYVSHAETTGRRDASLGPQTFEALLTSFIAAGVIREGRSGRVDLLKHRIVFPIFDELGRPIAFGGRKIRDEDEPKYLNSPESQVFHKSRSLYGIHLAKQAIIKTRVAIVTEGYTDVIACHAAGFTNVVATLGTALTVEHARLLRRLCDRVILLFDGDAAGMRAADRGVEVFFNEPIDVSVCTLPDDLDPDELLREADGAARFRAALDSSVDALAYLVDRFRRDYAARTGLSGRQQSLEALLRRLAELGFGRLSGVRKQFVLASLAQLTGVSEREIERAVPQGITPRAAARTDAASETTSDEPDGMSSRAAQAQDSDDRAAASAAVSRARREAERTLLLILLGTPSLATASIEVECEGERAVAPVTEVLEPGRFSIPEFRSLYRTWLSIAEGGTTPTFSSILAELADPAAKRLASDLFLEAERRRGSSTSRAAASGDLEPLEHLRNAFADVERLDRRDRFRREGSSGNLSAVAVKDLAADEAIDAAGAAVDPATLVRPTIDSIDNDPSTSAAAAAERRLAEIRARGNDVTAHPRFSVRRPASPSRPSSSHPFNAQ
jgi:DNA primase